MKITIYELLGLVKDGKAPSKVKWRDKIWTYNNYNQDYVINDTDLFGYGFCNHRTLDFINDPVEILEEENKIPEKLEEPRFNKGRYYIKDINGDDSEISGIERTFRLKINEIIDFLESKGDE